MIKRAHIHHFLAIVETGNFTQAAQRIRVTQPTLSIGIAELERLVGNPLFERNRRYVRLTNAGARFLPIARELQKGFRAADAFGQPAETKSPQLRLGVIKTLATPILQRIIQTIGEAFTLDITEGTDSDLRMAMGDERIDMMIGLLRTNETGAMIHALFEEPYVMFVNEGHALVDKDQIDLDELGTETMIARRSCEVLDQTSRIFTKRGLRPRFAFRSDSEDRCLALVAAGVGITTAPLSYARPGVVAISVKGYDLVRRIGVRISPSWQNPSGAALIDELRARIPNDLRDNRIISKTK